MPMDANGNVYLALKATGLSKLKAFNVLFDILSVHFALGRCRLC